jgi:hypothetical protein
MERGKELYFAKFLEKFDIWQKQLVRVIGALCENPDLLVLHITRYEGSILPRRIGVHLIQAVVTHQSECGRVLVVHVINSGGLLDPRLL